ncbi:MAG: FAD-dependent oxidoreductase, partial [Verrucomicrobiae bacterium]|nr:FAD-dependent oxidoreductase [Verrucomicrobiae bacterium]
LEDVLSRRTRCLLLDARASGEVAPEVAARMADLAGHNEAWRERELGDYRRLVAASLP